MLKCVGAGDWPVALDREQKPPVAERRPSVAGRPAKRDRPLWATLIIDVTPSLSVPRILGRI